MDGNRADPRVTFAVTFMSQHLNEHISMAELAARVELSQSRFRALFSEYLGTSPGHYLQTLRLQRARLLLERSFLSVKQVREAVGYADPSHFARDFRRQHGRPPTEFRFLDVGARRAPAR